MSLSLILTQSSGNRVAVFCIAWSAQSKEGEQGELPAVEYGWISVKRYLQNQTFSFWTVLLPLLDLHLQKFGPY